MRGDVGMNGVVGAVVGVPKPFSSQMSSKIHSQIARRRMVLVAVPADRKLYMHPFYTPSWR